MKVIKESSFLDAGLYTETEEREPCDLSDDWHATLCQDVCQRNWRCHGDTATSPGNHTAQPQTSQ